MRRGAWGTASSRSDDPLLLDHCHHAMHFWLMPKETRDVLVKDRQKHWQPMAVS